MGLVGLETYVRSPMHANGVRALSSLSRGPPEGVEGGILLKYTTCSLLSLGNRARSWFLPDLVEIASEERIETPVGAEGFELFEGGRLPIGIGARHGPEYTSDSSSGILAYLPHRRPLRGAFPWCG